MKRTITRHMASTLAALAATATLALGAATPANATTNTNAATTFADVNPGSAHYKEILWLAATGIATGYAGDAGTTFGGMRAVVRQDMAAFLYRMAGSPAYTPSATDRARFTDVDGSTPHAREIWWLASTGLATGFERTIHHPAVTHVETKYVYLLKDGSGMTFETATELEDYCFEHNIFASSTTIPKQVTVVDKQAWNEKVREFGGMRTVVRQDMAAFLHRFATAFPDRAAGTSGTSRAATFTDVTDRSPHAADVRWLAATGVATGYPDHTFGGMRDVVRQDMAAFLTRTGVGDGTGTTGTGTIGWPTTWVIDKPAWTETVVDQPEWTETVVDKPAWDETKQVTVFHVYDMKGGAWDFYDSDECDAFMNSELLKDHATAVTWYPETKTIHHEATYRQVVHPAVTHTVRHAEEGHWA